MRVIFTLLFLKASTSIITTEEEFQFYSQELLFQNIPFMIGSISKYCPFCNIGHVGDIINNQLEEFLIFYILDINSNEIMLIHSLKFDLEKNEIYHILKLNRHQSFEEKIIQIQKTDLEGKWHLFYITFDLQNPTSSIFGHLQKNQEQEVQLEIDQFSQKSYLIVLGGSLQVTQNDINFQLKSFPGKLRLILSDKIFIKNLERIEYLQNILQQQNECTNNDDIIQEKLLSPVQQVEINSQSKQMNGYYFVQNWFKVDILQQTIDQENILNVFTIKIEGPSTGLELLVISLNYKIINKECYCQIQYHNYDIPYFNSQDEISINQIQYLIDINLIFQWHLIKLIYQSNQISIEITNYLSGLNFVKQISNNYQYSSSYQIFNFGDQVNQNYKTNVGSITFTNCPLSSQFIVNYCHVSCKYCFGPQKNQCLACYEESNRIYNENKKTCSCQLFYLEVGQKSCLGLNEEFFSEQFIYLPTDPAYEQLDHQIVCSYGYFYYEGECIQCPAATSEHIVQCMECIMDPLNWGYSEKPCYTILTHQKLNRENIIIQMMNDDQYYFFNEELVLMNYFTLCAQPSDDCHFFDSDYQNKSFYMECDMFSTYKNGACYRLEIYSSYQLPPCEAGCAECYYNSCYYCLDYYYMSVTDYKCYKCNIPNCKQCFQYNQNDHEQTNAKIGITSKFSKKFEDYNVGCQLCVNNYIYDFTINECIKKTFQLPCLNGFISNEGKMVCTQYKDEFQGILQEKYPCSELIPNCFRCLIDKYGMIGCLKCNDGYYLDIINYICFSCQTQLSNVETCYQTSYGKDDWKLEVQAFYINFLPSQSQLNILNSNFHYYNVDKCQVGYTNYAHKSCFKSCEPGCQICDESNLNKMACSRCDITFQEYDVFSYFNDKCQLCPYPCNYCSESSQDLITKINSEFIINDETLSQTYQCLIHIDNKESTYFSINNYNIQQRDTNGNRYKLQINENYFTENLFKSALNNLQILRRKKIYTYVAKLNSTKNLQSNSLKKYIYTLQNLTLIYDAINDTNRNQLLNFTDYNAISINNLNYIKDQNIFEIKYDKGVSILLYDIVFKNMKIISNQFIFSNVTTLVINNYLFENLLIEELSFFQIVDIFNGSTISMNIMNFQFINCTFINVIFFDISYRNFSFNKISFENIFFNYCTFISSTFFQYQSEAVFFHSIFELRNLKIENTKFYDSTMFNLSIQLKNSIEQVNLKNISLQNSNIFLIASETSFSELHIIQSKFFNSNILKSLQVFQFYFKVLRINNLFFNDIYFEDQSIFDFSNLQPNFTDIFASNIQQTEIQSNDINLCFFIFTGQNLSFENIYTENLFDFSNFCIKRTTFIEINQVSVNQSRNFQSSFSFMIINEFQKVQLSNINIQNLNITNSQIFALQSLSLLNNNDTYLNIKIINLVFLNNFIIKSQVNQLVSIFSIETQAQCLIYIDKIEFVNNIIIHSINDQFKNTPGLLFIESELSSLKIVNCKVQNNLISFSSQSLWLIKVLNLQLENLFVKDVNQINNFDDNYQIQSIGGFSRIFTSNISVTNSYFQNIESQQGSCFYINLKNDGIIKLKNLTILESLSKTTTLSLAKGGSIYIDSSDSSLNLTIQNAFIQNSISTDQGGFLYLIASRQNNSVVLKNLLLYNIISPQYPFLQLDCSFSTGKNVFELNNVSIIIQPEAVKAIINQTTLLDQFYEQKQASIILMNCQITIRNFNFRGLAFVPIFYMEFSKNLTIKNLLISQTQLIAGNLIQILDSDVLRNLQIQKKVFIENFILTSCVFSQTFELTESISLQPKSIVSIQLHSMKEAILFKIKQITISNIQCSQCSQGIFAIESQNQNINFQIENINAIQNDCGTESCVFLNLPSAKKAKLFFGKFMQNKEGNRGALSLNVERIILKSFNFFENIAQLVGGGLFFGEKFQLTQNSSLLNFVSNVAQYGGAISFSNQKMSQVLREQCLFINNKAIKQSNNVAEQPSSLQLEIFGQRIENMKKIINETTIEKPNFLKHQIQENKIYLPSGQQISSYKRLLKGTLNYLDYGINLKIYAINSIGEIQQIDNSQVCKIQIQSQINKSIVFENELNFTNFGSNQSYLNLSQLTIIIDPYQIQQNRTLNIICDLLNQKNLYQFSFDIDIFKCQIGEYYYQNQCLPCESDKGYYSFKKKTQICLKVDPKIINYNKVNQISLIEGYWRPNQYSSNIEYCFKNPSVCQGGWNVGDLSCAEGTIGALCEECDIYDIRGYGQFYKDQNYNCVECGSYIGKIFYTLLTTIIMIFSVSLTVNSVFTIFKSFKRLKMASKFYDIIFRRNLDQSAALIKMIVNYFQILVGIHSFRLNMYLNFLDFLLPISNPFSNSTFSYDCFISLQNNIEILYTQFIIDLVFPTLCFIFYIFLYLISVYLRKNSLSSTIYFTALLYLFFYTQPNIIKEIGSLLAIRTISNEDFINKNVSYYYYTVNHQKWMVFMIFPSLGIFAFLLPLFLLYIMVKNRKYQHSERFRQIWGYIFNDYKKETYYWEILKIYFREIIIFTLILLEENILLKGFIIFLLLFSYFSFAKSKKPYNIGSLNSFEQENIFICALVIIVSCLKFQVQQDSNHGYDLVLQFLLFGLLLKFVTTLIIKIIKIYYEKLSPKLDPLRAKILRRYPKFIHKFKILKYIFELHSDRTIRVTKHVSLLRSTFKSYRQTVQNSLNVSKLTGKEESNLHTRHISNIFTHNEKHTLINQGADEI